MMMIILIVIKQYKTHAQTDNTDADNATAKQKR